MKSRAYTQLFKLFLLLAVLGGTISVSAQSSQDILLYSTDFTDWNTISGITSNTDSYPVTSGAGAGFVLNQKPEVNPIGIAGSYTGYYTNASSSHTITFPSYKFVAGGVVEVDYYIAGSSKSVSTMTGADYVKFAEIDGVSSKFKDFAAAGTAIGTSSAWNADYLDWHSGDNLQTGTSTGAYARMLYSFPASFTGAHALTLFITKQTDNIVGLKVWTSVGSTPYVCSPDYQDATSAGNSVGGLTITGAVGATTASTGTVNLKSYNLVGKAVSLSVEGTDAAKFSLSTASIADATTATPVTVKFTPSVKAGVSNALLKISAEGSNTYYVNLIGVSGSTTPQIVSDTATLNFYTYQTGKFIQTIDLAGLNLTGNVTATLSDNVSFAVSSSSIPLATVSKGTTLDVTFTGDINIGTKTATLTLSSTGAADVVIPLNGVTSLVKPTMYSVKFAVSPTGSAYVDVSPGGNTFVEGSKITATVTPETGYKIDHWSDQSGNSKTKRVFTISATTPQLLTVFLVSETQNPDQPVQSGNFIALLPSSITDNSFTANWSTATNKAGTAVNYTLTVTDVNGAIAYTTTTTSTSAAVSGLKMGNAYYYKVTTDSDVEGQKETLKVGPFYTTDSSTAIRTCGDDK